MVEAGSRLFTAKGCGNCHTGADTERAPSLQDLMGKNRTFQDGTAHVADEEYVRESILEPYSRLTQGYINTMPTYKGQLTEEQVRELVEYIKTLGNGAPGSMQPYSQTDRVPQPQGNDPDSAISQANQRKSAGATHFEKRGNDR
jgi:cytochrome c oxidase subunit 2